MKRRGTGSALPVIQLGSGETRRAGRLRPLELGDQMALYAVIDRNRARLRRWMPWLDATPDADALRSFLVETVCFHRDGGGVRMAIEIDRRIAGVIGIEGIDRSHRRAAIGYWLDSVHEGRGWMTRSVRAMCDFGFAKLGLNRIEIRAATGNRRSRAVPERLGFVHEGTWRQSEWFYDHFEDLAVYGMLASEWGGGS